MVFSSTNTSALQEFERLGTMNAAEQFKWLEERSVSCRLYDDPIKGPRPRSAQPEFAARPADGGQAKRPPSVLEWRQRFSHVVQTQLKLRVLALTGHPTHYQGHLLTFQTPAEAQHFLERRSIPVDVDDEHRSRLVFRRAALQQHYYIDESLVALANRLRSQKEECERLAAQGLPAPRLTHFLLAKPYEEYGVIDVQSISVKSGTAEAFLGRWMLTLERPMPLSRLHPHKEIAGEPWRLDSPQQRMQHQRAEKLQKARAEKAAAANSAPADGDRTDSAESAPATRWTTVQRNKSKSTAARSAPSTSANTAQATTSPSSRPASAPAPAASPSPAAAAPAARAPAAPPVAPDLPTRNGYSALTGSDSDDDCVSVASSAPSAASAPSAPAPTASDVAEALRRVLLTPQPGSPSEKARQKRRNEKLRRQATAGPAVRGKGGRPPGVRMDVNKGASTGLVTGEQARQIQAGTVSYTATLQANAVDPAFTAKHSAILAELQRIRVKHGFVRAAAASTATSVTVSTTASAPASAVAPPAPQTAMAIYLPARAGKRVRSRSQSPLASDDDGEVVSAATDPPDGVDAAADPPESAADADTPMEVESAAPAADDTGGAATSTDA